MKHGNGNGAGMTLSMAAKLAGWPTPNTNERGPEQPDSKANRGSGGVDLQTVAGWTTPQAHDSNPIGSGNRNNPKGGNACLAWDARMAGWATPQERDGKGIDQNYQHGAINNSLPNQTRGVSGWGTPRATDGSKAPKADVRGNLTLNGQALTSSTARTGAAGALNPAHSRWLMGYPAAWDDSADTATRSSRKSRRSSFKPT